MSIIDPKMLRNQMGLNLFYKGLSSVVALFSVPLLLRYLGKSDYGIWLTVGSVLTWIQLFDVGIGNGLRNRLAEVLSANDIDRGKKVISTSYVLVAFMAFIAISLLYLLVVFFDLPTMLNFNLDHASNANHILSNKFNVILFANIAFIGLNLFLSTCNMIFFALHLSSYVSLSGVLAQLITFVSILILNYSFEPSLLAVSIAFGFSGVVVNCVGSILLFKKYKELRPQIKFFDKSEVQHIGSFGFRMFMTQIAAMVLNSTDNVLISKILGPDSVTTYSIPYKIFSVLCLVQLALIAPLVSAYTSAFARSDLAFIRQSVRKMMFLFLFLSFTGGVLCYSFETISTYWLKQHVNYPPGLLGLICTYFIILMWCNVNSSILHGIGKINRVTIVAIAQAALNIPLSLFFAINLNFGLNGIILGSISVMFLGAVVSHLEVKKYLTL